MAEVKPKRSRLQTTLLAIILATIPFYLLGLVVLWVGGAALAARTTATPTATQEEVVQPSITPSPFTATPTLFTPTITETPTTTPTFTVTATYFIPSSTPSVTPLPSQTPTPTAATETSEIPEPPTNP
ncbi:MAG TPA: hypothetical protein DDW19_04215 [Anaerolineaceae bacterium]|nr:hypothetical protein [Anaerolineaceae bacterium]